MCRVDMVENVMNVCGRVSYPEIIHSVSNSVFQGIQPKERFIHALYNTTATAAVNI
jgi:hypothetical protein